MKKFIVETYYTCTFKTVHTLDDLNDKELSKIDDRTDGEVQVIDVKLNNRKTKKIGDIKKDKSTDLKVNNSLPDNIASQLVGKEKDDKVKIRPRSSKSAMLPEVEVYLHLLLLVYLLDQKKNTQVIY